MFETIAEGAQPLRQESGQLLEQPVESPGHRPADERCTIATSEAAGDGHWQRRSGAVPLDARSGTKGANRGR